MNCVPDLISLLIKQPNFLSHKLYNSKQCYNNLVKLGKIFYT